ncbi:MAG TPA: mannose-1-phosphate guanylyltransferase/mannose-6-phosphate isomerase [Steroidobacteraceae bacterium]|nr:mannose-1-phosphate guanylyltransferase/mannose-6-phosphate isomerase [Steroidobacteraceae bacterium]
MLIPVILSGGAGTRLWPLSRELYPKQFLPLVGERTMIQETALRTAGLPNVAAPIVVCNEAHRFLVAEQLRELGITPQAILLEPIGRNTAPAVAVAALAAIGRARGAGEGESPILLVLPADHVLNDVASLKRAVVAALPAAREGRLVTFGVVPTQPETGYGYIRQGAGEGAVRPVAEFVEKPDAARAQAFVRSGDYLWNSGMFLLPAQGYLDELGRLDPAMLAACRNAYERAASDLDFVRLDKAAFGDCRSDSIDYAVMEKTDRASVVALSAGWSDVGSFAALHEALPADSSGNVTRGDVFAEGASNCLLYSTDRLVAAVGLEGHVVIETKDAVMVAPKDRVQDVKKLVDRMKQAGRSEPGLHREVFRPWGSYDSVDAGPRFQVKRLTVKPGAKLSLQKHAQRAEHWVVVKGKARITRDHEVFDLSENESTYIPIGAVHRIENPGTELLQIIEVQSGGYLGEDDIVRIEDTYGRTGRTD